MPAFRHRLVPVVVCALAAACFVKHALADEDSPLRLRLNTTLSADSNVFRVTDTAADPQLVVRGISGKSDTYRATAVGLDFDKTWSQQRFLGGVTQTATRYDKFTLLDRDVLDYNAEVQWRAGPSLTGVLHMDHNESVVGFDDIQSTTLNLRSTDKSHATFDLTLYGAWHVLGGFYILQSTTSQFLLAQPPSTVNTGELGVLYAAGAKQTISLFRRSRRGLAATSKGGPDFINLIDNRYDMGETEVRTTWATSPTSTFNGALTYNERTNEHILARNFSRMGGELGYVWTPGSKITLKLNATRTITAWTPDLQSSFKNDDTYIVSPTWQATEKIKFSLSPTLTISDYLGAVGPLTDPPRRDILRSVTLTADWKLHRYVTLVASLQRQHKTSTNSAFAFHDGVATLTATIKY